MNETDKDSGQPKYDDLWHPAGSKAFSEADAHYHRMILDQYLAYVQTTAETSRTRLQTNAFFLTLNTALVAGIAVMLFESRSAFLLATGFIGLLAGMVLSVVWMRIIKSYRAINSAKFKVIGDMEERLPASPVWRAEWRALQASDSGYKPVTQIETVIPTIVIATYLLVAAYAGVYFFTPWLDGILGS